MGAWIDLYTTLRSKLVKERGIGGTGKTGAQLPRTTPADTIYALALIYEDVKAALLKLNGGADRAMLADASLILAGAGGHAPVIDLTTWLVHGRRVSGHRLTRDVFVRGLDAAPVAYELADGSPDQPAEVANLCDRWDHCLQLAGAAMALLAFQPTLPPANLVEWWSGFYNLCVALEVVVERPREGTLDRLKGATVFALVQSAHATEDLTVAASDLAGRITAHVAETAGKAAGAAAHGFFAEAGLTALMVVGVAVYIAMH